VSDLYPSFPQHSIWQSKLDTLEKCLYPKSTESIIQEYENEKWSSILRSILEDSVYDLNQLMNTMVGTTDPTEVCDSGGGIAYLSPSVFHRQYIASLHKEILMAGHNDFKHIKVVELGSGYGATLIPLANLTYGKEICFLGLELSESGVKAGQKIASHYNVDHITEFRRQDFNDMFAIDCRPDELLIILTSCSLLLSKDIPNVIFNILTNKPHIVIHSEPSDHSITLDNTPLSSYRARYLLANDYNGCLYECLKVFETARLCQILKYLPYHFGGLNPLLPMSLIKWVPIKREF
jgi:hypothetical protein